MEKPKNKAAQCTENAPGTAAGTAAVPGAVCLPGKAVTVSSVRILHQDGILFPGIIVGVVGEDLLIGHLCPVDLPHHFGEEIHLLPAAGGNQNYLVDAAGKDIEIRLEPSGIGCDQLVVQHAGCAEQGFPVGKDKHRIQRVVRMNEGRIQLRGNRSLQQAAEVIPFRGKDAGRVFPAS